MSERTGTKTISHNARVLEDLYFAKLDASLLQKKREEMSREKAHSDLKEQLFFSDETISELLDIDVDVHTLRVVTLIPLIQVAWADHELSREEVEAILRAAHHEGIEEGSHEHELLEEWLSDEPDTELFTAWQNFIHEKSRYLPKKEAIALREYVLEAATKIARASGGFLGFGAISEEESDTLTQIKNAFQIVD